MNEIIIAVVVNVACLCQLWRVEISIDKEIARCKPIKGDSICSQQAAIFELLQAKAN